MIFADDSFVKSNKGLITHLSHTYQQLERDEVVNVMWLAAATAGARKGAGLTKFICNSVQRQASAGLSLLSYFNTEDEDEATDWLQGVDNNDPLTLLLASEDDALQVKKHGSIVQGVARNKAITDRGARKAIERTLKHIEQGDLFSGSQS